MLSDEFSDTSSDQSSAQHGDVGKVMTVEDDDNVGQLKPNHIGHISTVYYIVVILIIGVPIWIKTTSPMRYSLPDIAAMMVKSQFTTNQLEISVAVAVDLDKDALRSRLFSQHRSSDGQVAYRIDWKVRQPLPKEEEAWTKSGFNLEKYDNLLSQLESHKVPGKMFIYLVDLNLIRNITKKGNIVYGSFRSIFIGVRDEDISVLDPDEDKPLVDIIGDVLSTVLEGHYDLTETNLIDEATDSSENSKSLLSRELNVILNFIPESVQDYRDFLDQEKLSEINILREHFIKDSGVSTLLDIKIMSQNVYYGIDSDVLQPKTSSNEARNRNERLFDLSKLALLLNSVESRIVEPNTKQNYHLHIIFPSKQNNVPIYFYDSKTNGKSFAAATSYRAGVFFWNRHEDFNLGFKIFMRNLLGLPSVQPSNSLERSIFLTRWELDLIMRKITLLQISKVLASLESLEKLLSKVRNIVILEEIASRMHTASDMFHQAIDALDEGDLSKALQLSSKAYIASESAFFDPSLLSQLYFPEDQKYAVYLPLFLPVAIPLLVSLRHLFRMYIKVGENSQQHLKKE
ncbi:phosphatidylinositol glycan anchor biosynthesis class S [Brevipalpus obovatus]|uniref:phosphatidylinositol glycan anchor biosynthesis class S n=1 Tax=Brevipalpus obovatus TaxID=246614 RepID=UPI003D9E64B6